MRELQSFGFRFALDDFGIGHSSLTYLRHLPIDQIRIDRSFISSIGHEQKSATLTQTIIDLGKRLGMSVVAEGVENENQFCFLREQGCTASQVNYLGAALAQDDFEAQYRTCVNTLSYP